jgi:hypothetical protein
MAEPLTPDQEAQARRLAEELCLAARHDFLRIARTLVAGGPSPFGQTEFHLRDLLLRLGARCLETSLLQKN